MEAALNNKAPSDEMPPEESQMKKCQFRNPTRLIIPFLEEFFDRVGQFVSLHPWLVLVSSYLVFGLLSLGLVFAFKQQGNVFKLWVPQDSDFLTHSHWLWENFPPESRYHSIIIEADNVLQPKVVDVLLQIHDTVGHLDLPWSDRCYEIPVIDLEDEDDDYYEDLYYYDSSDEYPHRDETNVSSRQKRDAFDSFDPSVELYPDVYCPILSSITHYACFETSLLEMFSDLDSPETRSHLRELTTDELLSVIAAANTSQIFKRPKDFSSYLGDVTVQDGRIVRARATHIDFIGRINTTALKQDGYKQSEVNALPVDPETLAFELEMQQRLLQLADKIMTENEDIRVVVNIARSFRDASDKVVSNDVIVFILGYMTLCIYIQITLGKFNCIEQRPLLTLVGIANILAAAFGAIGLCSFLGFEYSPIHNMIPFLILGIGIDDMFVICSSYDKLSLASNTPQCRYDDEPEPPVEHVVGMALRHAGVAITITSLTDIIVFGLGVTSNLPALQSFCVMCSVGILFIYILQACTFTAGLSLDIRRVRARRSGILCCFTYDKEDDWDVQTPENKDCWQVIKRDGPGGLFFGDYIMGRVVKSTFCKRAVVIITAVFLSVGIWGLIGLRQEFNPAWLLPKESSLYKWMEANEENFPSSGQRASIYLGALDYPMELSKIAALADVLSGPGMSDIISSVDDWARPFVSYIEENQLLGNVTIEQWNVYETLAENRTAFHYYLAQYLHSPKGAKYRSKFHFVNDSEFECGGIAPTIVLSNFEYTHHLFSGPAEHIPAMNRVKYLVKHFNFSARAFSYSQAYAGWETDEVIAWETARNLLIAVACIFVTTLAIIGQLRACFLVNICVIMTLVNVAGYMHLWGLTIDVISCINLVISVGLCVDYAAHIAHAFIVSQGSPEERAANALKMLGPAVFNGGFSTFLAFVFTCSSQSHVFVTFFKIFFLVVVFGLFHGLIFLPVVLSLVGGAAGQGADASTPTATSNRASENEASFSWVKILRITPLCESDMCRWKS